MFSADGDPDGRIMRSQTGGNRLIAGTLLWKRIEVRRGAAAALPAGRYAGVLHALGKQVDVQDIQRDRWIAEYRKLGFSDAAAQSHARMTAVSIKGGFEGHDTAERGGTTLSDYMKGRVTRRSTRS